MWTKIKGIEDINKLKLNSRVLKFTGSGTPLDPPISDPAYTLCSLMKNTGGSLDLKSTNPLFSSSLTQVNAEIFHKTASQIIHEAIWWY
jgi:hypothetical protein